MRKVKKQDEIKIKNVPANIKRYKSSSASSKTVKAFIKLEKDLSKLSERDTGMDAMLFMRKVYQFIDLYMSREIYKFTECAKGCAYCCRLPVSTSALEAYYLYEAVKDRSDIEFVNLTAESKVTNNPSNEYCPLLDQATGTCSAYEYRPLNCRSFASLDGWSECIEPLNEHHMHAWSSNEMLKSLRQNMDLISSHNDKVTNADIRDWFKSI
ncbi:YkgJ family cysteine cluster protein [Vibrio coralliirubri]|uniref:YkgJ family cysteine cluster protein n=1 Tax=Vibrio coralliirubri TaxID=1516159 RepID=UPI002284691D|nr:YkgJ family cysteine cluster protein [Vibrio coralliirubri]MCY9861232.1 YkgJ family cysteine cluster protein [Vibrio coralliirubri]